MTISSTAWIKKCYFHFCCFNSNHPRVCACTHTHMPTISKNRESHQTIRSIWTIDKTINYVRAISLKLLNSLLSELIQPCEIWFFLGCDAKQTERHISPFQKKILFPEDETVNFSETLKSTYESTWRHNPQQHRRSELYQNRYLWSTLRLENRQVWLLLFLLRWDVKFLFQTMETFTIVTHSTKLRNPSNIFIISLCVAT